MIVVRNLDELQGTLRGACVTIGNFDGVHKGHQKLLARTRERALASSAESVAVTFDPHPMSVLACGHAPPFITLIDQKLELISAHGLEICVVLEFTRAMAALVPEEFVRQYLVEALSMKHMVIGYDYAFGKGRKGNYELLTALGQKYGYGVERVGPYMLDDAVVSSTRIRDLIKAGKVWEARPLLDRFYTVKGEVQHGANRGGKLLGFPTANLKLIDELFPATGVYAVWATHEGRTMPAVANIGYNPTFGNAALSVEVHILDFDKDIYGRELRVQFVQRLRSEKKFEGIDELKTQIGHDIELGRTILSSSQAQP
ncbi:MAG: bifunctional riboflavin kinase/FAD synthetase [Proteobacteria bacterium]|nr:bifunctional riboflavin kinase/FAD synthetase [Pseudomonadota bacterium]